MNADLVENLRRFLKSLTDLFQKFFDFFKKTYEDASSAASSYADKNTTTTTE